MFKKCSFLSLNPFSKSNFVGQVHFGEKVRGVVAQRLNLHLDSLFLQAFNLPQPRIAVEHVGALLHRLKTSHLAVREVGALQLELGNVLRSDAQPFDLWHGHVQVFEGHLHRSVAVVAENIYAVGVTIDQAHHRQLHRQPKSLEKRSGANVWIAAASDLVKRVVQFKWVFSSWCVCVFITAYHDALQRLGDVIIEQLKEGGVLLNDQDELGTEGGHLQAMRPLRDHLTATDAVAHHRDAGDLVDVGEVAVEGALWRGENVQLNAADVQRRADVANQRRQVAVLFENLRVAIVDVTDGVCFARLQVHQNDANEKAEGNFVLHSHLFELHLGVAEQADALLEGHQSGRSRRNNLVKKSVN